LCDSRKTIDHAFFICVWSLDYITDLVYVASPPYLLRQYQVINLKKKIFEERHVEYKILQDNVIILKSNWNFAPFRHSWGPALSNTNLATYLLKFSWFNSKCESRKMPIFYWHISWKNSLPSSHNTLITFILAYPHIFSPSLLLDGKLQLLYRILLA
jgi:hypothetical protein